MISIININENNLRLDELFSTTGGGIKFREGVA